MSDNENTADIVARLRDWRSLHLTRLGGLFDEAADAVESLRREVLEQRREIAGLREERRALLDADRPQPDRPEAIAGGDIDRPQPIADARLAARLAALQQLSELDEELELPRTPNPHATPSECSVLPECTDTGGT